jgi:hypothetical protein
MSNSDWDKLMEERQRVLLNLINLDIELERALKNRLEGMEKVNEAQQPIDFYEDEKTRMELSAAQLLTQLKTSNCDRKLVF